MGRKQNCNTCGKKDPPSLPKSVFPLKVLDLSGEAADDGVLLKGRILKEGKPEEAVPHVKGCRVYVARYSLENPPCEGCPLAYREVYGFGPEVMTDQGFMCRVPVRKAGQDQVFRYWGRLSEREKEWLMEQAREIDLDEVSHLNATLLRAATGAHLDLSGLEPEGIADRLTLATAEVEGFKPINLTYRAILDLPEFRSDKELGCFYTPERTTIRVFAPTATKVAALLYAYQQGGRSKAYDMKYVGGGVWEVVLPGDAKGAYYTVKAEGWDPGLGREVIEPYAKCNSVHNGRTLIFTDETPVADPPDFDMSEAIIYETHVRDFTIDERSGVRNKGKYLGFTERGTLLTGTPELIETCLDHIIDLGINVVHLLPIQDFENDEASPQYNWGYMPVHFNSPDGWYATETYNAKRVEELRAREHACGLDRIESHLDFTDRVKRTKRDFLAFLIEQKNQGKQIVAYGAAAKGNTLLNYCGVGTDFIDYIVDRSPHKQGLYLPGSRIPIHAPERIRETKPDFVVILAWNLKEEVMKSLSDVRSWGGRFVVPIPSVAVFE